MTQPQEKLKMSSEEYLEFERVAESKKVNHNRIGSNINRHLGNQLADRPCDIFLSDMRVKVQKINKYTYPDIVVVCGDLELEDQKFDTLLNPMVIIEILSNSTELYDRGEKFTHYRLIPSLKEYILVSQYCCQIEKFVRGDDGVWRLFDPCTNMEESIRMETIDCELLLSDIYYRVEFENKD